MTTRIDIQGPLEIRIVDESGVTVLLKRFVTAEETLYIDTEPAENAPRVVTMDLRDGVNVSEA
jgi:hypothetical protein